MIPFLNLKAINAQYREELLEAMARVITSAWETNENFDTEIINTIGWYLEKSYGV